MATLSETIQEGLNKMAGIAIARQDPAQALMVATLSSIASVVSQLEYNVFYYQRKAEELEKAVGTIPVATYADLVAYANPVKDTFFSVTADEQNNGGNASIYMKNAAGEIIWFAAQKMN